MYKYLSGLKKARFKLANMFKSKLAKMVNFKLTKLAKMIILKHEYSGIKKK